MKRVIVRGALLLSVAAFGWWCGSAEPDEDAPKVSSSGEQRPARTSQTQVIKHLRTEVAQRDRALQWLMLQQQVAPEQPSAHDAERDTREQLEARMTDTGTEQDVSSEARAELQHLIDSSPSDARLKLLCGGRLCSVDVRGSQDEVRAAVNYLVESAPKSFGGTVVHTAEDGSNHVFYGRDAADVSVESEQEPVDEGAREVVYLQGNLDVDAADTPPWD